MQEKFDKITNKLDSWCFKLENQIEVLRTTLEMLENKHNIIEGRVKWTEDKCNSIDMFVKDQLETLISQVTRNKEICVTEGMRRDTKVNSF